MATVVGMIFTWIRYGKPDVSIPFNAALAGLVAITAPCDCVTPVGAFFIGLIAGFLVVLSVEFFDNVAKIDDPVGAVSVHMVNGMWGTLAVGLFSNGGDGVGVGLFYGGGFKQLGIPASNAINMFYKQIILQRGLPFEVKLPDRTPTDISMLRAEELHAELEKGYADMKAGRTKDAKTVFADIRKEYGL